MAGFLSKLMGFCGCCKYSKGSMDTFDKIKGKTFDPHPKLWEQGGDSGRSSTAGWQKQ